MKKIFVAIIISIVAISSASAFQLGVMGGVSLGAVKSPLGYAINGENNSTSTFTVAPSVYLTIPHNYGSSNWFGQAEAGLMGAGIHLGYNVGYTFHIAEKFSLAPFAGLVIPNFFIYGFGFDVGAIARMPLGIGDLTVDVRYIPSLGILISRQMASVAVGYTFRFGKDKH